MNHEVYLDVDAETVKKSIKRGWKSGFLKVGRELDALNARMLNPNYVDKAPAHLVKQTREGFWKRRSYSRD